MFQSNVLVLYVALMDIEMQQLDSFMQQGNTYIQIYGI